MMRFNMLADSDWESKIDRVLNELSDSGYRRLFADRDYGPGVNGVTVVFMCQDSALDLKRRVRFSKKEKKLYMDVMLDLHEMKALDHNSRKRKMVELLAKEVPQNLSKYQINDFDMPGFVSDLHAWCTSVTSL